MMSAPASKGHQRARAIHETDAKRSGAASWPTISRPNMVPTTATLDRRLSRRLLRHFGTSSGNCTNLR